MTKPQSSNPSNQSDTSSGYQQSSSSKPSNSSPPPKTEIIFDVNDMATSNFSESPTDVVTFTISDENDTDS